MKGGEPPFAAQWFKGSYAELGALHTERRQCARIAINRSIRDLNKQQISAPPAARYVAHIANPLFVLMMENILNI